jgi:hypothetical protein
VIIRCTSKVTQLLKLGRLPDTPQDDDDWYVNVATVARRRVVLAVHADTLFPIVAVGASTKDLRDLPAWLACEIEAALRDEGLGEHQLGSLAAEHAVLARTSSRKVLGHLTQLAFDVEYAVTSAGGWDREDLDELNRGLRRHLRSRDKGYFIPLEAARERTVNPRHEALLAQFKAGLVGTSPEELRSLATVLLSAAGAVNARSAAQEPSDVTVLQLSASLDDAGPMITRTLEVPADLDLERFHRLLQRAFGWEDYHLYRYARGGSVWDRESQLFLCDLDIQESEGHGTPVRQAKLAQLLTTPGDQLHYLYDYGDSWHVTITLDSVTTGPRDVARIIGGTGTAPPEDVGGIDTWNEVRDQLPGSHVPHEVTINVRTLSRRRRGR